LGPINIRYHVISLAAVFLALGVGIIVGSNTNFFGISSLIEKQNAVIGRLEENYKEIRKEVRATRTEADTQKKYIETLEAGVIPPLLAGKLDGLHLGAMIVGGFMDETRSEEPLLARLKASGANIGWKIAVPLQRLDELLGTDPTGFMRQISGELLSGNPFGTKYTDTLITEGLVEAGAFGEPVGGVVFILGDDLDIRVMRKVLLPMEAEMAQKGGLVLNVSLGENSNYKDVLREKQFLFVQNAAGLPGQVEAVSNLSVMYLQKAERQN